MRWAVGLLGLVLSACATVSGPRTIDSPRPRLGDDHFEYLSPSPTWPLRTGASSPLELPVGSVPWATPSALGPGSTPSSSFLLPEISSLPVKQTPPARVWTPVTQEKIVDLPVPSAPTTPQPASAPLVSKTPPSKTPTSKTDKAPATVPAVAAPKPGADATPPATVAASASLLPTSPPTSSDFQWQDVNAVAGDAVTLHFDKANWLYLDPPSQQKTLGFQSINRDKDSTTFQFRPLVPGQYTLDFQRQDLAIQTNETRRVRLTVGAPGTRTASTGTTLSPQTSTTPANSPLEASKILAAGGKTSEAVQKLLEGYRPNDTRTNLELARLLDQTGQDDEALSYLDKNLSLPGADFQGTLELGTRLAATRDPVNKLPAYTKLWMAGTVAPPEALFLQAFEALRSQKQLTQAKEWAGKYASWYPEPQSKDRYLFELGQLLEDPGTPRDIKGAWKAYNELVESYPLSPFWKAAGERAAYLNRHFLQVR